MEYRLWHNFSTFSCCLLPNHNNLKFNNFCWEKNQIIPNRNYLKWNKKLKLFIPGLIFLSGTLVTIVLIEFIQFQIFLLLLSLARAPQKQVHSFIRTTRLTNTNSWWNRNEEEKKNWKKDYNFTRHWRYYFLDDRFVAAIKSNKQPSTRYLNNQFQNGIVTVKTELNQFLRFADVEIKKIIINRIEFEATVHS